MHIHSWVLYKFNNTNSKFHKPCVQLLGIIQKHTLLSNIVMVKLGTQVQKCKQLSLKKKYTTQALQPHRKKLHQKQLINNLVLENLRPLLNYRCSYCQQPTNTNQFRHIFSNFLRNVHYENIFRNSLMHVYAKHAYSNYNLLQTEYIKTMKDSAKRKNQIFPTQPYLFSSIQQKIQYENKQDTQNYLKLCKLFNQKVYSVKHVQLICQICSYRNRITLVCTNYLYTVAQEYYKLQYIAQRTLNFSTPKNGGQNKQCVFQNVWTTNFDRTIKILQIVRYFSITKSCRITHVTNCDKIYNKMGKFIIYVCQSEHRNNKNGQQRLQLKQLRDFFTLSGQSQVECLNNSSCQLVFLFNKLHKFKQQKFYYFSPMVLEVVPLI
eukprot:TRINITY_DN22253_c0_g2_i2.p1 TRINITY_DN22253_c0_g2~~TRINITY_DN22253_c0_g2_i2.p1  ORF type:complete len:378 (+),score=-32.08 TRINITY_DN22253_c0_g2_i2:448-1581(+)